MKKIALLIATVALGPAVYAAAPNYPQVRGANSGNAIICYQEATSNTGSGLDIDSNNAVKLCAGVAENLAPLTCYQQATDNFSLYSVDAVSLCVGAESLAPIDCYRQAKYNLAMRYQDAIKLCMRAENLSPISCYRQARNKFGLPYEDAIKLCATPIRYTDTQ